MTTTIDCLLAALESGDNSAWGPLSDALREQHDDIRADGALWLQREGKRPVSVHIVRKLWGWNCPKGGRDHKERSYWLPPNIYWKACKNYDTFAAAILDAARAVGEALEKGELKP